MKTLKATLLCCTFGLILAVGTVKAQSTWNYFISDAGSGNSLVTWSVTGDLTTSPGPILQLQESSLVIPIVAPGIYASSYSGDFTGGIPTLDGSYFAFGMAYNLIDQFSVNTAAANGNQSFGLAASLPPKFVGVNLVYTPGTQSDLLPIPFSDFNPGTYQSVATMFTSPITVNLTVESAPEPSTAALAAGAILSAVLAGRKAKGRID